MLGKGAGLVRLWVEAWKILNSKEKGSQNGIAASIDSDNPLSGTLT